MTAVNDSAHAAGKNFSGKRSLLDSFFSAIRGPGFTVGYWDGTHTSYGDGEPEFRIDFRKEPGLLNLLSSPSLFFGDGYMLGDIDVSGSFLAMARALDAALETGVSLKDKVVARAVSAFVSAARPLTQQKSDIAAHYDLGNDFFSLWLDKPTLSYSCAYYRDAADSLETAQRQKLDLVLRKLHLEKGMRVLDIGCGWGALAIGAAKEYGAKVLAVTLSEEQAAAVKRRCEEHGLGGACEVRLCNYLELEETEPFDRVVSVGMFEHVGKANHADYFGKVRALLRSGGVSLLHTLTKNTSGETDPWIAKRIFPGGRIPAVTEVINCLPENDFHLLHVESLRRHYVKTLDVWHDNFSRPEVLAKVRSMFDQAFVRMWSLYLRMASAFLAVGDLDVHQFVFSKGVNDTLPLTLEGVYRRE